MRIRTIGMIFVIWGFARLLNGIVYYTGRAACFKISTISDVISDKIFNIFVLGSPILLILSGIGLLTIRGRKIAIVFSVIEMVAILLIIIRTSMAASIIFIIPVLFFIFSFFYLIRPKIKEQFK